VAHLANFCETYTPIIKFIITKVVTRSSDCYVATCKQLQVILSILWL